MKVAVFGKTLYAGVISALLAESGHDVYWCDHLAEDFNLENNFDDPVLKLIIVKQKQQGFLNDCYFEDLDLDIDAYWFCLGPHEQQQSLSIAQHLKQRPLIHPKLMINTATFGLYGTQRLQQILEDDEWVYLPDNIREGDALGSLTDAEQLIVGCDCGNSLNKLQELLRPLFPLPQQYVCMPILDAEFSKLSISGMLGSRISFINDLALVAEKIGVDIHHVRSAMAADPRIGGTYLFPGVGFGGEHFSHDILTLTRAVADAGGRVAYLNKFGKLTKNKKNLCSVSCGVILMAISTEKLLRSGAHLIKKIPRAYINHRFIPCSLPYGHKAPLYVYMILQHSMRLHVCMANVMT